MKNLLMSQLTLGYDELSIPYKDAYQAFADNTFAHLIATLSSQEVSL